MEALRLLPPRRKPQHHPTRLVAFRPLPQHRHILRRAAFEFVALAPLGVRGLLREFFLDFPAVLAPRRQRIAVAVQPGREPPPHRAAQVRQPRHAPRGRPHGPTAPAETP